MTVEPSSSRRGARRPRLHPWFRAVPLVPEGLYLLSEHGESVLRGAVASRLGEFLDGRHTVDEIVERFATGHSAAEVLYTLALAEKQGFIGFGEAPGTPGQAAFWGLAGLDPAAALATLQGCPVSVVAFGEVPLGPAADRLTRLGFSVRDAADLTVVLVDDYLRPELEEINKDALADPRRRWLLARPTGSRAWIGPVLGGAGSPCWECMAHRIRGNREIPSYLEWRLGVRVPADPPAGLPATSSMALDATALRAARAVVDPAHDPTVMHTLDFLGPETARHRVIRRPQCHACGDPALSQAQEPPRLRARRAFDDSGGTRIVGPEETVARFEDHVSPIVGTITDTGPVPGVDDHVTPVWWAGHNFAVRSKSLRFLREGLRSKSAGKGTTSAHARASAMCEAIERYSGIFQGDEPRIRSSYRTLGEAAIHPNESQLFSEAQYHDRASWLARNSRFAVVPDPFDEDAELEWSRVWSLTGRRWRYLPTGYLYYGYPHREDQFYFWGDSNGNAAGNCLEEAVLQGFLELAERDAVCLWWYCRASRPGVDLDALDDSWIARVRRRYAELGRPLWLLDVTNDLGIPTFVALSRRVDKAPEDILLASAAHPDPLVAVRRAIGEMNQFLPAVVPVVSPDDRNYAFDDPDCVRWWTTATVENQPYLLPDPGRPPTVPVPRDRSEVDLLAEVERCRRTVERLGLEMLVLDQTRPDIGLPVAKVLVPGLRHFWARLAPGRLYDVPVQLGWVDRPVAEADLNPIPLFL